MEIKSLIAISLVSFLLVININSYFVYSSNEVKIFTYGITNYKNYEFIKYLPYNTDIDISISLKLRNLNELYDYLKNVENPESPIFHKFINKEYFFKNFSPYNSTVDLILNYLKSYGINAYVGPYNIGIFANNVPVYKVEEAFHIKIGLFKTDGFRKYVFMPLSNALLPENLAIYVDGISGLSDNIVFKTNIMKIYGANVSEEGGGDLQKAYQVYSIFNESYYGNMSENHVFPINYTVATVLWEGIDNAGQQVAPFNPSDIYKYYNMTVPAWEIKLAKLKVSGYPVDGAVKPGPNASNDTTSTNYENTLDLEMVTTMAPGVNAVCVYGPGNSSGPSETNFPDEEYAALSNLSNLIAVSNSWGGYNNNGSEAPIDNVSANYVLMLESTGTTFLASAGDLADAENLSMPANYATNYSGFLAVGGTTLIMNGPSGVLNGSGIPVLNAINNQIVWYDNSSYLSSGVAYGTTSGTSKIYPIPGWQDIQAVINNGGSTTGRNYADVSAIGNNTIIVINNSTSWIAGTSVSSPVTAGIIADMVAFTKQKFGFIDPLIYRIGSESKYLLYAPFWDVVQTPYGYHNNQKLYWARPGWDYASGWGSINAYNFSLDLMNMSFKITIIPLGLPPKYLWNLSVDNLNFSFYGNATIYLMRGYNKLSFYSKGYIANPSTLYLNVNKNITIYINFYYDGNLNIFVPYLYPDYNNYWNDLKNYSKIINGLQYESYNISKNGTLNYLGDDNVTNVTKYLKMDRFPMIVNDYNITRTELLLNNVTLQEEFINYAVSLSIKYNYTGFSIDFENPSNADFSINDSYKFVLFINNFSIAMHEYDKKLIVAIEPAYNGIPNSMLFWYIYHPVLPLYADYYALMAYESNYSGNYSFMEALKSTLNSTGQFLKKQQIMVILSAINYDTNMPFSYLDLQLRINYTLKCGIKALSIFSLYKTGGLPQTNIWNYLYYYETYNLRHYLKFQETGLEKNLEWGIKINNYYYNTTSDNITLFLISGNYSYEILKPDGYNSNVSNGNIYLNKNITIYVLFYENKYKVTFISNYNITWNINISGNNYSVNGMKFIIYLPNGSYNYSVYSNYYYSNPGYFEVNGKNLTVYINFSKFIFLKIIFINYTNSLKAYFTLNNISYVMNNSCMFKLKNGNISLNINKYIEINKYERILVTNNSIYLKIHSNYTVYINLIKQFFINISSNPNDAARFTINSGFYNYSEILKINIIPNRLYRFYCWIGEGNISYSGTLENITIKVLSPINETAYFKRIYILNMINSYNFSYYLLINSTLYFINNSYYQIYLVEGNYTIYGYSFDKTYNFNYSLKLYNNYTLVINWILETYKVKFIENGIYVPINISINKEMFTLYRSLNVSLSNGTYILNITGPYYIEIQNYENIITINGTGKIFYINVSLKNFTFILNIPQLNNTYSEIIIQGRDVLGNYINISRFSNNGTFIIHIPAGKYNYTVLINKEKIFSNSTMINKNLSLNINISNKSFYNIYLIIFIIVGVSLIILSYKRKRDKLK
ncbi:MAG: protease pro-enzyme activation domain-containing protein [Thermoplasmata archaeon]